MVEPISMSGVSLVWKGLAKVPSLTRWILRWRFPVQKCRELLIIEADANSVYFDLQPERPSHSLGGVELRIHNHLPFGVVLQITHVTLIVNSSLVLDAVLNNELVIQASNHVQLTLPQLGLAEQQVKWLRKYKQDISRIKMLFNLRCQSKIHSWEEQCPLGFSATINSGDPSSNQGGSR